MVKKGRLRLTVLPQIWLGAVPRHECEGGMRPCPRIECRYHLEAKDAGTGGRPRKHEIRRDESQSCAIDCADDGPLSALKVAALIGTSRHAVERIEARALRKLERFGVATLLGVLQSG